MVEFRSCCGLSIVLIDDSCDSNAVCTHDTQAPHNCHTNGRQAEQNALLAAQLLNLPPGAVRSFVLDNDPVPRAMLSVDPTFAMLKQSAPMSWVLEARRAFLGSGVSFTPEKFLYENVGDVRSPLLLSTQIMSCDTA